MRPKTNSNLFGQTKPILTKLMKIFKNIKPIISYILGAILVFGGVVLADKLIPTGSVIEPTMVTLEDIYQKTQDFTYTTNSHDLSTTSVPAEPGTMHTLSDIWTGLTDFILPPESKVEDGYAYGPNGSLEGSAPAGTPTLEWSADQGSMTWDAAETYCQGIGGGLPTIDELIAALTAQFVNSSPFMSGFAEGTYYWSGTENVSDSAWFGYSEFGDIFNSYGYKSSEYSVRCVR